MYRGSGPRIMPLIIIVIVVALVIAALVTVGKMIFSGNNSSNANKTTDTTSIDSAVLDRADGRSVRWTVRGPIVADEKFRSYQITISPKQRIYTTYSGYLDQIVETKTFENNANAYEQFVYALTKANIGKTRKANDEDFRGVCATKGVAYMFETMNGSAVDQSIWSSTCKDSPGTLASDPLKIQALFVNQVPDFQPQFNQIY